MLRRKKQFFRYFKLNQILDITFPVGHWHVAEAQFVQANTAMVVNMGDHWNS